MANLEIAEMCARSGANCGSLFLDVSDVPFPRAHGTEYRSSQLRFRELVKTLLADHPAHLDAASLAYFQHAFSETDKLSYKGETDDRKHAVSDLVALARCAPELNYLYLETFFHFTCFNTEVCLLFTEWPHKITHSDANRTQTTQASD